MEGPASATSPWYARPQFRRTALTVLAVIAVVEGYFAVFVRENDFVCHRGVGAAFLAGDPYSTGQDIYPVGRAMINSLLAVGPLYPTRAVCYALAVLALAACYGFWRRMTPADAAGGLAFAAAVGTVALALPHVVRDLDECGMQTFLLFFLSAAGYSLYCGRPAWSGFWLATAAVYKVTPVLFLPFLLWKRQWRAAGWTAAFLVLWTLAPVPFLGWSVTMDSHRQWLATSARIGSARDAYPWQPGREEPKVYNLSLAAAAARYLETYPPGHPLYVDHPAFVQFGDLAPEPAYYAVRGVLLALALVLAWRFRRGWRRAAAGVPGLAAEWAAVCVLCAIVSPVCWKQHLVLILPALFLSLHALLADPPAPRWRVGLLAGSAAVMLLARRTLVGKELETVLLSYKLDTFAVLILLLLVLTVPARRGQAGQVTAGTPADWPQAA